MPSPTWRRRVAGLTFATIAGSAAAAPSAPPYASVYRQIKDWTLVCDNTRYCEAKGLVEGDHATMRIEREAGPNTSINLVIDALGDLQPEALRVDDKPTALQQIEWNRGGRRDLSEAQLSVSQAAARRALAPLVGGLRLTLGEPAQNASISLVGLQAVLLAMDELQGRLDTPGALIRTGPLAETRVAPAQALPYVPIRPVLPLTPPQGYLAAVRTERASAIAAECSPDLAKPRDEARALSATEMLVFLECRRRAYQSEFLAYRVARDDPKQGNPLALPVAPGIEHVFGATLSQPEWDLESGTLTVGAKGRGVADCGYWAKWRFSDAGFVLAEFHEQRICAGRPWDWPALYRTKVSRE
jgi:hypothetical protein